LHPVSRYATASAAIDAAQKGVAPDTVAIYLRDRYGRYRPVMQATRPTA
jgi:hypothetical protein